MKKIYIYQKNSSLNDQVWLELDEKYFQKEFQLKQNQIIRFNNLAIKVKAIIGTKEFQRFEYLKQRNKLQQGEFPLHGLKYIVEKNQQQKSANLESHITVSTQSSLPSLKEIYNKNCRICFEKIRDENETYQNCVCYQKNPVHFKCFKKYHQENFVTHQGDNFIQYPLFSLKCDICSSQLKTCFVKKDFLYPFINPKLLVNSGYAVLEIYDLNKQDILRSIVLINIKKNCEINFGINQKKNFVILEKENYGGDNFIIKIKNKKLYLKLPNYGCAQISLNKLYLKPQKKYDLIQENMYFTACMTEKRKSITQN